MSRISNPYDSAPAENSEPGPLFCANHPNVPTYLRCGRCEKPICARCRIATPVGYRCAECANIRALPTYSVSTPYYARSIGAGFALATGIGAIWAGLPALDFWAALILGIGVSEVVSAAANMKRGPGLQAVALAAVAWGFVAGRIVLAYFVSNITLYRFLIQIPGNDQAPLLQNTSPGAFDLLPLFLHTDLAGWLFMALAFGLAYIRLR